MQGLRAGEPPRAACAKPLSWRGGLAGAAGIGLVVKPMTQIDPLARVARPVDAVVERLRSDVLRGAFPSGGHLPPERQLALALGVSRLTLRAALARLEAEGLVRARQGEGVRVLDLAQHGTLAVLAHMDLSARPEVLRSFLELRRAVAADAGAPAR